MGLSLRHSGHARGLVDYAAQGRADRRRVVLRACIVANALLYGTIFVCSILVGAHVSPLQSIG